MTLTCHVQPQAPIPLWNNGAPGALGHAVHDIPTLTPYIAAAKRQPTAAMVICPGGGYGHLASHEGHDYALWLNAHAVTGFVLHYRLGSHGYRHPSILNDAARAVRLVRAHARQWSVDPQRVGIMGSSAGGHLAATLLTHFDMGQADADDPVEQERSRPDLGILCYPVISMGALAHEGSKQNLLGDNPPVALVNAVSNELHVTAQTPPCFIWHTWEDPAVKVEHSLEFATALRRNNVPFDLHIYQQGRHGIGLGDKPPFVHAHPWTKDVLMWLERQGVVNA